jgi:hypothetical protein
MGAFMPMNLRSGAPVAVTVVTLEAKDTLVKLKTRLTSVTPLE